MASRAVVARLRPILSKAAVHIACCSLLVLHGPLLSHAAPASPAIDTVEQLVEEALASNQQIISAKAKAQQYNTRIPLVDNLSDPFLAFYYLDFPIANISGGFTQTENQEKAKPALKVNTESVRGSILTGRDMVENQALWFDYLSEETTLQVVSSVKENFFRLYFLDKIIASNEQNLVFLDSVIEAIGARYSVGKESQSDVLRVQAERYQLQAELIRLQQRRLTIKNSLNYLTARPLGKPVSPAVKPELTHENLPKQQSTAIELSSTLYQNKPLIKGYQALGGRFKAMRGMVQMYFNREVQDEAMYEADSGYRSIKAKGTDYYNETIAELQTTVADIESNRELANLYGRVIVPQTHQAFEANLADFRVNQESYKTVLKTLLDLNKQQTLYYQALSDYMTGMAKLELLSGVNLNER